MLRPEVLQRKPDAPLDLRHALDARVHCIHHAETHATVEWDAIREYRPALAVLGADMPGYSGVEIARRVRAYPDLAGTRVLIITAHANPEAAGLTAGADRWLAMPFSPRELRDVARALLGDSAHTADTPPAPGQ